MSYKKSNLKNIVAGMNQYLILNHRTNPEEEKSDDLLRTYKQVHSRGLNIDALVLTERATIVWALKDRACIEMTADLGFRIRDFVVSRCQHCRV
jgi:hypothetical protein